MARLLKCDDVRRAGERYVYFLHNNGRTMFRASRLESDRAVGSAGIMHEHARGKAHLANVESKRRASRLSRAESAQRTPNAACLAPSARRKQPQAARSLLRHCPALPRV